MNFARGLELVHSNHGTLPHLGSGFRKAAHCSHEVMGLQARQVTARKGCTLRCAPGSGQQRQLPKEAPLAEQRQHLFVHIHDSHMALGDEVHLMSHIPYVKYVLPGQKHSQLQAHDQLRNEGILATFKQGHLVHDVKEHPVCDVVEHGHGQLVEQTDGFGSRVAVGCQVLKVLIDALLGVCRDVQVPHCVGHHVFLELVSRRSGVHAVHKH
mmetsp:Transcript_20099/g.55950  ORF Transcript_20099/g.55950 Transcript_20099/m.55950 type:complete len:211 (-) Transcript_20099:1169-1801(-)